MYKDSVKRRIKPGKRGNMFPETIAADTCFPSVSQFCHTGICFCCEAETYFAARNNAFRVAKPGNIRETCVG